MREKDLYDVHDIREAFSMMHEPFYVEAMTLNELEDLRSGLYDLWIKGFAQGNENAKHLHFMSVIRLKNMILNTFKDDPDTEREYALARAILRENEPADAEPFLLTDAQKDYVVSSLRIGRTTGMELYDDIAVHPLWYKLVEGLLRYAYKLSKDDYTRVLVLLGRLEISNASKANLRILVDLLEKELQTEEAGAGAGTETSSSTNAGANTVSGESNTQNATTATTNTSGANNAGFAFTPLVWSGILAGVVLVLLLLIWWLMYTFRKNLKTNREAYYYYYR